MDTIRGRLRPGGRLFAALLLAALALFALAAAACGDDNDKNTTTPAATSQATSTGSAKTADNAITIEAFEMGFKVSGDLRPGTATITLKNTGSVAHMMATLRVKDGVTLDQVKQALQEGEDALTPLGADSDADAVYGTPALVGAGQSSTTTALNLKAGNYVILCFVQDENGMPHAAMGMVNMFTVKGDPVTTTPKSDGDITITDAAITLPAGFTGKGTYKVTDTGTKPHTLSFAKLDEGKSLQDYVGYVGGQFAAGKPIDGGGGVLMGGIDSLNPGQTAYVTVDLAKGHYGYVSTEEGDQLGGEFDVS